MRLIEIFCAIILILALMSIAGADIGLDVSCYNSEEDMSFSLDAENIDYDGAFELASHGISFQNKGESTAPESSYSLMQSFNGDSAYSNAATDSGSYEWAAQMSTGIDNTSSTKFAIGALHNVDDGFLSSGYGNDEISTHSDVITSEASYSEKVFIDQDNLAAVGSGATHFQEAPDMDIDLSNELLFSNALFTMSGEYCHGERGSETSETGSEQGADEIESKAEDSVKESVKLPTEIQTLPGFIQEVNMVSGGDWAHLKAAVIGKEDTAVITWNYGLQSGDNSVSDEYSSRLGLVTAGATPENFKLMAMEGEGSDIPLQYLPPGSLNIKYQSDFDSTLHDIIKSQYQQYISEQTDKFYDAYASPEDLRPTTWYSWNQWAFISLDEIEKDTIKPQDNKFEYFKMSMLFDVNSDESIQDCVPLE